jgi:hypothetical protein
LYLYPVRGCTRSYSPNFLEEAFSETEEISKRGPGSFIGAPAHASALSSSPYSGLTNGECKRYDGSELRERAGRKMEPRQRRGIAIGALVGAVLGGVISRLLFGPGTGIYIGIPLGAAIGLALGGLLSRP